MSFRALIVGGALLAGCSYHPGSFSYAITSFPGTRATVGCLDVAVQRDLDLDGAAVLKYSFGNRCDRPTLIDLNAVAVVGRTVTGDEIALSPVDPNHEIKPLPLDGRLAGKEALAYASDDPLLEVCVDLASIGRVTPARWQCFASVGRIDSPAPAPAPDAEPAVATAEDGAQ